MVHVYSSNPQSDSRWQIGKQFVTLFLVIGVISVLVISGYFFYKKLKTPVSPALDAIPLQAACIIKVNDWFKFSDKLNDNSIDAWSVYINQSQGKLFKSKLFFLDSLLKTDEDIENIVDDEVGYFSFHIVEQKKVDMLFTITVGNNGIVRTIDNFFFKHSGKTSIIASRELGQVIKKSVFKSISESYYYAIVKGIFIGSFSESLVKNSIQNVVLNNSLNKTREFRKVILASGSSADLNIFVNFKYFSKMLSLLVKEEYATEVAKLEFMASWNVMDISFSKKQLLLSGITITADSLTQYLKLFKNQIPEPTTIQTILPSQTIFFTHFSLSNLSKYIYDLQQFNNIILPNDTACNIQVINKRLGITVENFIIPYIQNEIAVAVVDSGCSSAKDSSINLIEGNSFAVLKTNYPEQLSNSLQLLSDTIGYINTDTILYKGHLIKQVGINNMLPALFGLAFKIINKSYYTVLNNYLIFSNCSDNLIWLIKQVESSNVLANNKQYKEFAASLSEKSNILVYCNLPRINPLLENYLQPSILNAIIPFAPAISKFNSMALQITSKDDFYLTNILISSITEHDKNINGWKTSLDTTLFNHPFLFYDSIDSMQKIIVFDCKKNMYMLDIQGQILWKKTLREQPIGDVFIIDYYKNGRLQFVFNSENYIYGFDHNGVSFGRYPIHLPFPSTGKMNVFDFDTIKEYRYLVPTQNKIYNYNKEGNVPNGWKCIEMTSAIVKPVRHIIIDNEDILAIADQKGSMQFTDKKGESIIKMKSIILQAKNSDFFLGKLRGHPRIITTESNGSLCYISRNGDIERVASHQMSTQHNFILADINSDNQPEYIYIDKGGINAFKYNGSLVGSYKTVTNTSNYPLIINIAGVGKRLCYVSTINNNIFLFDEYMQPHFAEAFNGSLYPVLFQDVMLNTSTLITGSKNAIYGYTLNW